MEETRANLTCRTHHWREVIGVPVAVMSMKEVLDLLETRIDQRRHTPVAFLNANNANIAVERPDLKQAFDHFLVLADGIGVDLASLVLHGAMFPENLNGTDLVPSLLKRCKGNLKVALVGARTDVAESAREAFQKMCPQHQFVVVADGFFKERDESTILTSLESMRPDILLVAMGVPRQELWIARAIDERHCTVPIAVGALFDIFTGTVPRAPNWMIRLRIEWVYRLWREPKRLWRRYLIGNPVFLGSIISAKLNKTSSASGDPRSLDAGATGTMVPGQ